MPSASLKARPCTAGLFASTKHARVKSGRAALAVAAAVVAAAVVAAAVATVVVVAAEVEAATELQQRHCLSVLAAPASKSGHLRVPFS